MGQFKASLERVAAEFEVLARQDARLPLARRDGCSAVLAVRAWEFSEFTRAFVAESERRRLLVCEAPKGAGDKSFKR